MMNKEIKQFIKENIDLIKQEQWEDIYNKNFPIGFTETLLEAGVNPLEQGLNYIPEDFLKNSRIKEFIIPNNITSIDDSAFRNCTSLTNITIPNSVESIDDFAFKYCVSLTSITYLGTKKEAMRLDIGNRLNKYWREFSSIEKIICTDGIIEL